MSHLHGYGPDSRNHCAPPLLYALLESTHGEGGKSIRTFPALVAEVTHPFQPLYPHISITCIWSVSFISDIHCRVNEASSGHKLSGSVGTSIDLPSGSHLSPLSKNTTTLSSSFEELVALNRNYIVNGQQRSCMLSLAIHLDLLWFHTRRLPASQIGPRKFNRML